MKYFPYLGFLLGILSMSWIHDTTPTPQTIDIKFIPPPETIGEPLPIWKDPTYAAPKVTKDKPDCRNSVSAARKVAEANPSNYNIQIWMNAIRCEQGLPIEKEPGTPFDKPIYTSGVAFYPGP